MANNTQPAAAPAATNRIFTGVSFQPDTLRYLDALAEKLSTSRSWVLNQIVLEHAALARQNVLRPLETLAQQPQTIIK
ncbi:MAG: hypothetical protein KatS3mg104_1787 [Phycisphaerae bacterium]|jgi:hypothetical protein|nr:MAG: hypothetical protein KatS3mg104_1787 [Phycisphaerae bacterium]